MTIRVNGLDVTDVPAHRLVRPPSPASLLAIAQSGVSDTVVAQQLIEQQQQQLTQQRADAAAREAAMQQLLSDWESDAEQKVHQLRSQLEELGRLREDLASEKKELAAEKEVGCTECRDGEPERLFVALPWHFISNFTFHLPHPGPCHHPRRAENCGDKREFSSTERGAEPATVGPAGFPFQARSGSPRAFEGGGGGGGSDRH